jgi:2-alkyl-3-oxoalkanoate reductase
MVVYPETLTMPGRVVVIGATGYLGRTLLPVLAGLGHDISGCARSAPRTAGPFNLRPCDAADPEALATVVAGADVVVNAMTGPPQAILAAASNLAAQLRRQPALRLIQLSSLAVFGQRGGVLNEESPPQPAPGHAYAAVCLAAELSLRAVPDTEARCVILRAGCIYGPASPQWTDRLCRLLLTGRLGWLGTEGAGLSPLIHVTDVSYAIAACLGPAPPAGLHHLLSPENLTWNLYFRRLARRLGMAATPRVTPAHLDGDTWFTGPARALLARALGQQADLITPAMRRLFRSRARLASIRAPLLRPEQFTLHDTGIAESVSAFVASQRPHAARWSLRRAAA